MGARSIILVALICFLVGTCRAEPQCNQTYIDECMKPLQKYEVRDESSIVPNYPVEQMREICRLYVGVKSCIKVFEHKCHTVDRKWFQGVHDSYQYLCDDHFEEYERHRDCLATPELHLEGRACNWTLYFSFDSDLYKTSSSSYKAKRICQYAKTYLSCVENLVHSFCGSEAASWQRGFDETSLHPLLSAIGCRLGVDPGVPRGGGPTNMNVQGEGPPIKHDLTGEGGGQGPSGPPPGSAPGRLSTKSSPISEQTAIVIGVTVTLIIVMFFLFTGLAMWVYSRKKHASDARNSATVSRANGAAVYVVDQPGAEGDVSVSPYAYSTPSPIPPPYAEKPPAYGLPDESDHAGANGAAFPPVGAAAMPMDAPALDVKLPLPPDYEASPPSTSPPTAAESPGTPAPGDSDYLVLQPQPTSPPQDESGYSSIGEEVPATAPAATPWVQFPDVNPQMPLPNNTAEGQ